MADTDELLKHLNDSREALRHAVNAIPKPLRERRPDPARWSVAENLEHLAIVERRLAGRLRDAVAAAAASASSSASPGRGLDPKQIAQLANREQRWKTNAASEPKGGMTADQAWAALEEVREETLEIVRQSDGLALAEPIAPHPVFGPWNFRQWVAFAGGHDARHADQIREMAPALTSPPVVNSVLHAIGHTPIVRLRAIVPQGAADVVVKLEFLNPTGSYKTGWRWR